MRHRVLILFLAASSVAACAGPSGYTVSASVASPASPDLVYIEPGVYAVANADQPVFYADNSYWLYADGIWYQSDYLTGGWRYAPPPYVIRQIRRPLAYHRHERYRPERQVHIDIRDRRRPVDVQREVRERPPAPPPSPRVIERDRPPPPPPSPRVIERDRPTAPPPSPRVIERDRDRPPAPPPSPRVIERDRDRAHPPAPRVIERDREHDKREPARDHD